MNNSILGKVFAGFSISSVVVSGSLTELLTIITLVIGIISGVISILFSVIGWYNKASEDGEISVEEVRELVTELKPEVEEILEEIKYVNKD